MTTTNLQRRRISRAATDSLAAAVVAAALAWAGHALNVHAVPAAVVFLSLVVLVSLRGRLTPALLVAVGGTLLWDVVFTGPLITRTERELRGLMMLVAFSGTAVVITRLVTALKANDVRWRNVFENNPTMYFMIDAEGTVLSVNSFGAAQLGYAVDELVGQSVLRVFFPDDKPVARDHVGDCLAHMGESLSWELRKVRKDGSLLWVRETARAVQLGSEPPIVLVACEDITEQKEAQDKLRASEAQLRGQASLLDLTHDAIFVRDQNDVIVYWNRGAERAYGWSSAEAIGRVSHELTKTVFPEPLDAINATLLRTGRWDGELVHTKRDGTRVVDSSRWSLERDAQGRPARVLETDNDITERKRAEEERRRSEAYLAEAQRVSHTGSWAWNVARQEMVHWSEEQFRTYGLDPKDGVPAWETLSQLIHPDDRASVLESIARAIRDGSDCTLDYRAVLADGTLKYIHSVGHPVLDASGELVEYVGTEMDVTAQKKAEEERQAHLWFLESMDRVNRAMHGGNDVEQMTRDVLATVRSIFDCDAAWLVYPCDPEVTSFRVVVTDTRPGFPDALALGMRELSVEADTAALFRAALATDGPVRFDPTSATHDDGYATERARRLGARSLLAIALHPKVGEPYLFGVDQRSRARVWTPREDRLFQEVARRMADALTTQLVLRDQRETARRYQNIFQTAAVSIWEEDFSRVGAAIEELRSSGVQDFRRYFAEHPEFVARAVAMVRIIDVNDTTVTMFGARSKEELLVSLHKVFTPETLDVFAGELLAVAEGRTTFAAEAALQTVNGERIDVLVTIAFPPEPHALESVLVTIMDVTARKRAEEALQRAQGELARASTLTTMGELAGSIAHELRQPLAAIAMNGSATLRWLNRESPDVAEATAAAARIVREAQRADEVIRSLRALLEKSELQRAPLDVNGAIHEVLGLVRGELRRNDVSIQTVLGAGLPPALGDRVQLQQVVLNLVMNGIEAMSGVADRPRTLAIRTERAGAEGVAVVVEDAGPGLDPATAERIFDPFFTTKPNGLGMGLSICRSIVEAHGGELSASPRSPHGTTFRFTVPTVAEAAVPSLPSAVAEQRASGFAG